MTYAAIHAHTVRQAATRAEASPETAHLAEALYDAMRFIENAAHPDQADLEERLAEAERERDNARAELTRLQQECRDGLDALSDIDDFWEACPYPGNRRHLSIAEQLSSLVRELNAAHDALAQRTRTDGGDQP